jgi:hypothetical protein
MDGEDDFDGGGYEGGGDTAEPETLEDVFPVGSSPVGVAVTPDGKHVCREFWFQ